MSRVHIYGLHIGFEMFTGDATSFSTAHRRRGENALPFFPSPILPSYFFLKILVFASTLARRVGGRRRGSEGVTGWGARAVPSEKE